MNSVTLLYFLLACEVGSLIRGRWEGAGVIIPGREQKGGGEAIFWQGYFSIYVIKCLCYNVM